MAPIQTLAIFAADSSLCGNSSCSKSDVAVTVLLAVLPDKLLAILLWSAGTPNEPNDPATGGSGGRADAGGKKEPRAT